MIKKKKKPELASIKAEKDVVKESRKICVEKEINLYDYTTRALQLLNRHNAKA